jgi:hypothetical protein
VETAGWSWQEGRRIGELVAQDLDRALLDREGGQMVRLTCADAALRYVMPQRIALPLMVNTAGLKYLQLRVARPVNGRLRLVQVSGGERTVWEGPLRALPERRILVPLSALATADPGADIEIRLIEEKGA